MSQMAAMKMLLVETPLTLLQSIPTYTDSNQTLSIVE